ncbi:hypothetical protein EVAR_99349_1 [Eumeta japonica]|uniref:Uncharacterized protein n=1 Tax=Eumeta variegata TaxID=151549 RepID=A0A4C1SQ04_EUMVA|nr:hypothetical protein EVAR_99349_1 [Eumeta japonica]
MRVRFHVALPGLKVCEIRKRSEVNCGEQWQLRKTHISDRFVESYRFLEQYSANSKSAKGFNTPGEGNRKRQSESECVALEHKRVLNLLQANAGVSNE